MEVYILDDLLRRTVVIDRFESFIWTDRWRDIGDFELVVHSTPEMRRLLTIGTKLATNESDRFMIIEDYDDKKDTEGRKLLTLKGRSGESILEQRVATTGMAGLTSDTDWLIDGTPGDIARKIFNDICVLGILNESDIIPFYTPGTTYAPNTISEPSMVFQAAIPMSSVYEAIKNLCDIYDLGFRLVRNFDNSQLFFHIYTGNDRTAQQSLMAPVIFSPELDNLTNPSEVQSISKLKNVAYVFSQQGSEIVYAEGASSSTAGFNRRVLYVDARDVADEAGPTLTSILQNKGYEALAKNRGMAAFDGEVNQHSKYRPRIDYDLGDLVEMRNDDGATNQMRVTEIIFVSDHEGERAYPTLTTESYVMPGTWISWDALETWDAADGTWDE